MEFKEGDKVVFFPSGTAKRILKKTKLPAVIVEDPPPQRARVLIQIIGMDLDPRYVAKSNLDSYEMYPELFE